MRHLKCVSLAALRARDASSLALLAASLSHLGFIHLVDHGISAEVAAALAAARAFFDLSEEDKLKFATELRDRRENFRRAVKEGVQRGRELKARIRKKKVNFPEFLHLLPVLLPAAHVSRCRLLSPAKVHRPRCLHF